MVKDYDILTDKDDFIDDLNDFILKSDKVLTFDVYYQWNKKVLECFDESLAKPDKIMDQFDRLELYQKDGIINIDATMDDKIKFLNDMVENLSNDTFADFIIKIGAIVATGYLAYKLLTPGKIFIIHGRDIDFKNQVVEYVQKITGQMPIILSEQTNKGQTVIEKLHSASKESDYAIALMTNDDYGGILGGRQEARCRQNVLLELGMFMNKNRRNVTVIKDNEVELPSDLHGLTYSTRETWKTDLMKNLKEAGYTITIKK